MSASFEFAINKNADQLHARLTAVEKSQILRASPDGLEYLRQTAFRIDGISVDGMDAIQKRLNAEFASASLLWQS